IDSGTCAGRVCIVTGAGQGLGREYALALARLGANVVVNDLGVDLDGQRADRMAADVVAEQIVADGGAAVASDADIASWSGAGALIESALDAFGRLDVLVNNAGIL